MTAAPRVLTLDIPDIQVLVHFPDDAVFTWHHRILLRKLTAGVWLCLTPDQEVVRHDLNTQRHVVLDRASGFPAGLADDVYAFDPISRVALEARKRNAAMQAAVLGEDDPMCGSSLNLLGRTMATPLPRSPWMTPILAWPLNPKALFL